MMKIKQIMKMSYVMTLKIQRNIQKYVKTINQLNNISIYYFHFIIKIDDFAYWVTANMMSSIDVEECTSIFEDYIKSNEHIIQRINKVMPIS